MSIIIVEILFFYVIRLLGTTSTCSPKAPGACVGLRLGASRPGVHLAKKKKKKKKKRRRRRKRRRRKKKKELGDRKDDDDDKRRTKPHEQTRRIKMMMNKKIKQIGQNKKKQANFISACHQQPSTTPRPVALLHTFPRVKRQCFVASPLFPACLFIIQYIM